MLGVYHVYNLYMHIHVTNYTHGYIGNPVEIRNRVANRFVTLHTIPSRVFKRHNDMAHSLTTLPTQY